jgi:cytochrome c peroxidase
MSVIRKAICAAQKILCFGVVGFCLTASGGEKSITLDIGFSAIHKSSTLVFGEPVLTNQSAQIFSVTRLDFLLSDFALHQKDGGDWLVKTNCQAFISIGQKRTNFFIPDFPAGVYDRIGFRVGLTPEINHGNPANYGPEHALNPNVNGLHWMWANGYIFLAIEGHWLKSEGDAGYSFHLGNDWMSKEVDLPLPKNLTADSKLNVALDLEKFFNFPFTEETASTHSRKGDPFAIHLRENLQRVFRVAQIAPAEFGAARTNSNKNPTPFSSAATPYRFTFSADFPIPDLPRDNPLTQEGVRLGSLLFFEKALSINGSQSCASCHNPTRAFTDSPRRKSIGAEGKVGTRNSMPIFNLAWKKSFFWDGRARSIREQVLEPIQNPIEMHETLPNVVSKLNRSSIYRTAFEKAFGSAEITAERIALALEQFLLTQVSCDSKFDRALKGSVQLSEEEKRGFELFVTEYDPRREQFGADCFHCHGGPLFQNQSFANNGLDSDFSDLGLFNATKHESDKGKFAVPSLRNVEITAPYMHDGRFRTLEEVVEHYATGVKRSNTLDPNIAKHPAGGVPLSAQDKKALVAFLKTLTDEKYKPALAKTSVTNRN